MEPAHRTDIPPLSEAAQQAFFETVLDQTLQAEARTGTVECHLDVAGVLIRLIYAGESLRRVFGPALSHLDVVPDRAPDATFHIWDSASSGVEIPPPPFPKVCYTDRGDIWSMNSPRIRSAFHWIECSVNLMDLERGIGVYWVRGREMLPYWCHASPLRTLLHWTLALRGRQLLHAAAVGDDEGALLITGRGGVGKSTTALSCLVQGMRYVADDYLVVGLEPEPRAYSLYATAKLEPDQLRRFPEFRELITNRAYLDSEKAIVQLWPTYRERLALSLPLKAVATPRFAATPDTTFGPAEKLALHRAAAFTTLSQLPHAGRATHEFIERLVDRLPGLDLALGQDLAAVPAAIQAWLRDPAPSLPRVADLPRRPLVSVIVPVYNGAAFLGEAVANILGQDYPALEIIVVDDGSTDAITEAVARLPVDVRFFRQPNAGAASARNRGIKDASGEFIAFLDVDDLWPPGNLGLLVERLARTPTLDVIHGHAQILVRDEASGVYEYFGNPGESFPYYIGAGLYRRRAFERVGLFDTELRYAEDTDWFNRAGEVGLNIERLEMVTLHVRRHGANMTAGKSLAELNALRVFKKALDRKRAAVQADAQPPMSGTEA